MRYWRVAGNFHTVGEVMEFIEGPNWQGALRKGALALKRNPKLKGKKITAASFILQESSKEMFDDFTSKKANLASQIAFSRAANEGHQGQQAQVQETEPGDRSNDS